MKPGSYSANIVVNFFIRVDKFGVNSLVQWQANSVVLLNRGIEQTFHRSVFTHTLLNLSIQPMFGNNVSRLEPFHILWIVEHVLDRSKAFMHSDRISRQDNSFHNYAVGIGSNHGSSRHQFLFALVSPKDKDGTGCVRDGTEHTGRKETSVAWKESFKLVLVAVQVVLGKDRATRP